MYIRLSRHRRVFKEGVEYTGQRGLNAVFRLHIQSSFEYIYINSGVLELMVDGVPVELGKGEAVLLFPDQLHSIYTPVESDSSTVIFSPQIVPMFSNLILNKFPRERKFRPVPDINTFVQKNLVENQCDDIVSLSAYIYMICSDFLNHNELLEIEKKQSYSLFVSAIRYMQQHFTEQLTLKILADKLGVNQSHLSRVLNAQSNIGFSNYLKDFRFDKAAELLRSTDMSVSQVAYSVGFRNIRSFNQCFLERANISPTQFRKRGTLI